MVRRIVVTGALLLAALGVPRPTHAGLLDFIWEMSGPRMIGVGYGCFLTTQLKREECRVHGVPVPVDIKAGAPHRGGPFLVLDASYLFSTPHDPNELEQYDWGKVQMLMLEPALAFRSIGESGQDRIRIYHGVGLTWDYLIVKDARNFDKFGYKFTPIDIAYKQWAVALEIRLYPNGFTADEFGFGPRLNFNRPNETTYGVKVSWAIGGNKPFAGATK